MALGGHDYSSSSLFESGLAILHTFVAGGLLTNVDSEHILPGLHQILAFYAKYFAQDRPEAKEYLDVIECIKKSGAEDSCESEGLPSIVVSIYSPYSGYAQIPNLPNLYLLEDLKGLLMLIVVHRLGPLLSIRANLGSLSNSQKAAFSTSNAYSKMLLDWISANFTLGYEGCHDGEVVDSIPDDERLLAVFDRWFQGILVALVDAKRFADEEGIKGASTACTGIKGASTAGALAKEIDKVFGTKTVKPSRDKHSYNFPAPPAGYSYEIRRRT
jgi:hypothetical protein